MRNAVLALSAAAALAGGGAAAAQTAHEGVPALSGPAAVTGRLVAHATGPLERTLEIAMSDRATGRPITNYDLDLTKELHLLATNASRSVFIHEHGERVGPDGRFRIKVRFPAPGLYQVYADALPAGLGQQVLRFKVPVDGPTAERRAAPADGEAGPYKVVLETAGLREGADGTLRLKILRNGKPATDLAPYLGVAAHAVFVGEDFSYVHAHAGQGSAKSHSGHGGHGSGHGHGHSAPAGAGQKVEAALDVHVTPPKAGSYVLWVQFIGGGEVRTARFTVEVAKRTGA